jgi:hypothetical protein
MGEQTIDATFDADERVRAAQIANVVVTLSERISEDTNTPACGVFQEIIKLCIGSMYINDHGGCAEALLRGILAVNDVPPDASIN